MRQASWLRAAASLLVALLSLFAWAATTALANGGTIQVSRTPAGPYLLTIYTDPTPVMTGSVDVSVLVEQPGSPDLVEDALVTVAARPSDGSSQGTSYPATHDQATNKLFYAANVRLPTAGAWHFDVTVEGAAGSGSLGFDAQVNQASLLSSPFTVPVLILVPAALLLTWSVRARRARPPAPSAPVVSESEPSARETPSPP